MPSKSKSQQRFFGMVNAYKNGKLDTKGLKPEYLKKIKKTAADMSTQDVEDFAKTKHDKLPEKKKDNGLSTQVYPDKKENRIVRFNDFDTLNELRMGFSRYNTKLRDKESEKFSAKAVAKSYADKYGSYNTARRHFLENVVNNPYSNKPNSFVDDFWVELKKIFPS